MPMMTTQILKSVDFTKIQKSRYLEKETLFFIQTKKFNNCTSRATLLQKTVLYRRQPLRKDLILRQRKLDSIPNSSLIKLKSLK